MPRIADHFAYGALFNQATEIHDGHKICGLRDNAEIMRDENDPHVKFTHEIFHQINHLGFWCLGRHGRHFFALDLLINHRDEFLTGLVLIGARLEFFG